MAQCADITAGAYTTSTNPPTDISECANVIIGGLEYENLQMLINIANTPIDYMQSAGAFSAVFIATFLYWLAVFQAAQFLDVAQLVRRT